MEEKGSTTIYNDGSLMIIVGRKIIDENRLKWRANDDIGELTLNEISSQLNTREIIYVWYELGLSGKIYQYGNYEEGGWWEHGTTKGFA